MAWRPFGTRTFPTRSGPMENCPLLILSALRYQLNCFSFHRNMCFVRLSVTCLHLVIVFMTGCYRCFCVNIMLQWTVMSDNWDALSITVTSYWARWRLKSPASGLFAQPFIQTQIKENIKAPRQWPLCGEFTDDRVTNLQQFDRRISLTTRNAESVLISCLWPFHFHKKAKKLSS